MRTLTFHQGFKLDRERLATLLRYVSENAKNSKKDAATYMGVGQPAAEGTLGWLIKSGLGTSQKGTYTLSCFGDLVAKHDPELSHPGTLWLLHYYLTNDHNERAEVWYRAFNEFLHPGASFTRDALQTYVERSLDNNPANKSAVNKDCNEFVKSYITLSALGKLNLIRDVARDTYEAELTHTVDSRIVAFVLFDAWQRRFPHVDTLRVSQVHEEPELLGKIFVARRDQVAHMLQVLQSMGLVNLVDSQHEPVTRRFRDEPEQFITAFYGSL